MAPTEEVAISRSLSELLAIEKQRYIEGRKQQGGTAEGFRQRIRRQYSAEPLKFNSLVLDALMEAATRKWEQQPRKRGPDLLSIGGETIPEILTRPAQEYVSGEEIGEDCEEVFEKVHQRYATVNDLIEDATIKLRKAAQSSAAAERQMTAADIARNRARGNLGAFLHDLQDTE